MAEDVNNRAKRGMSMKMIVGAVVLLAVIIVGWSIIDFPPKDDNVQGTIGMAEKYRTDQVTAADVKLDSPEMQALLQNDKIQALLKSPDFRKATKDEHFLQALGQISFRKAASDEAIAAVLTDQQVLALSAGPGFAVIVQKDLLRSMENPEIVKTLTSVEFQNMIQSKSWADINSVAEVQRAISGDQIAGVTLDVAMKSFVEKPEIQMMLADPLLRAMLAQPEQIKAFADEAVVARFADPGVRAVLADPVMHQALEQPEVRSMLADPVLREAIGDKILETAMASSNFRIAAERDFLWSSTAGSGI